MKQCYASFDINGKKIYEYDIDDNSDSDDGVDII